MNCGERKTAYIGMGSSLGNRLQFLQNALCSMHRSDQSIQVTGVSPVYETPHMGLTPEDSERYPPHFNAVARISSLLAPRQLLAELQLAEEKAGRQREQKWGPRTLDLDLLLYEGVQMHAPELTLPHPGLLQRAFVLLPLAALEPKLILPDGARLEEWLHKPIIKKQQAVQTRQQLHIPQYAEEM